MALFGGREHNDQDPIDPGGVLTPQEVEPQEDAEEVDDEGLAEECEYDPDTRTRGAWGHGF
jgi:hypothetical protein